MRQVNRDRYKYLGVQQFDFIMNIEMNNKVENEYIRRVEKLLKSQLNGENVIVGMNPWAVGIIRYGAGVLDRTKEELKSIEIKIRKFMIMNGSLQSRGNVGRLHLARNEGGRGLTSYEERVNLEVQSLDKYLSDSKEWMLKFAAGKKGLSEVEDSDAFKKRLKEKSVAGKTIPWWIPKRYRENEYRENVAMVEGRTSQERDLGVGVCSTGTGVTGKLEKAPY